MGKGSVATAIKFAIDVSHPHVRTYAFWPKYRGPRVMRSTIVRDPWAKVRSHFSPAARVPLQANCETIQIYAELYCQMEIYEQQYCCSCAMWLNGRFQYEEHCKQRKHRKNVKDPVDPGKVILKRERDKGVVAPRETAFIIDQSALFKDSKDHAMLSLYAMAALRARM
jgi:hypothetical protein